MPNVLFATNRQQVHNTASGIADFGDTALPSSPDALFCATATVGSIDVDKPDAGVIISISEPRRGGFADADLAPVLGSQNDILVFVHGAAKTPSSALHTIRNG